METTQIIERPLYTAELVLSTDDCRDFLGQHGPSNKLFISVYTDTQQIWLAGIYVADSPKTAYDSFIKAANQAALDGIIPTNVPALITTAILADCDTYTGADGSVTYFPQFVYNA